MNEPSIPPDTFISAAMIRAARGLLNLSQTALGECLLPKLSRRTISKIETDAPGRPDERRRNVLKAIREALEGKGIEFLFGDADFVEGVRLRRGFN
ncbi:transcriptional regulator [Tardiphaga sp. vice154]|uniref:transcriptional regulator n=1 Tax=Tardiphaga sp. vice154 TaxID=2592814 RepID=UPI00116449DD|nr:transcriptional regulator [Tardiphaga sp. vice154]QDM20939.1 transcriptional regulator [Tardiphaga sp. vice154]